VAKVTGPDRERLTISQERGSLIGTLEYMSPEQCSGEDTVGTASDVYSLGVVLYELVTETRPYDFSSTSLLGAVQRVQLKVPDRPSERKASVSKELNAVVLKAMEKEPSRRYASAAEFADDVRRYLQDRPVLARPASSWYHLRLFAKRNKALVAALAGIMLALVAGILGTARMARVASLARDEAIANERVSEQIADFQGERIRRINVQAMGQQTQKELLSAVRKSLEDDPQVGPKQVEERMREFRRLLERVNFTTITLNTLHDNVLAKAEASINAQFVDQPLVRARLLQSLARTNFEHGLLASALQPLQEATRLRVEHLGEDDQETLLSRLALAELLSALGRRDESLEIVQDVVDRRIALLGDDDPLTMRAKSQLGGVLNKLGRVDEAEAIWAETLERRRELLGPNHESTLVSLNNMGLIHAVKGDYDKAETVWRELVERRREKFGPNHRTYRASLSNLGLLLVDLGKLKEARAFLEESLESARAEMGDDHPETLRTMSGVAALRSQLGDLEGARELLRENYEGRLQVLGVDHQDTLRALVALGDAESRCGDLPLAEQLLREAIAAQEDLLGSDHADLIISNAALARVLFQSDQLDEAEQVMQRALDLATDSPRPLQAVMGQTLGEFGRRLLDLGQAEQAELRLLQAHEILAAELGDSDAATQEVAQNLVELYAAQATDPERDERVQRWRRAAAGVAPKEEMADED
ncbi:MAG: tetratricopeptide repeat protein, partial [Planctomycetota bacterium]